MDNPEKQTKHKITQQAKKTKLTNTGDMNTYAYKYRGYEHICLQIPGIWTHMLTKDKHFLLLIKGPYKSK